MENNFDKILHKYLSGEDLSLKEIQLVESQLTTHPDTLESVASELSSVTINPDLAIGIDHWATTHIKKELSTTENDLYQEGFFINTSTIDQYLSGELEGEPLKVFDKRLQRDESFAKEVEHHTDLLEGIATFSEQSIKNDLDQVQLELEKDEFFTKTDSVKTETSIPAPEAKIVKFGFRKVLAYAATVLLLVSAGFWFFNQNNNSQDHFAAHFQPYQDVLTEDILDELSSFGFGEISEKEKLEELQSCMELYNKESFQLANTAFEKYLKKYPNDLEAKFYQSLSLIELGKYKEAISQLDHLHNTDGFSLEKASTWYLALVYLKNKQPELTKNLLKSIADDQDSPFQKDSQNILNDL